MMVLDSTRKSGRKTAFVTGGGKGIGAAIVRGLAEAGNNVVFTYSSSEKQANKLVAELQREGQSVTAVCLNVADAEQSRSVIEKVASHYGTIDIVVNNAGVFKEQPFSLLVPADFEETMDVNLKGAFLTVLYAQPYLPNGSRVVTIGSVKADNVPSKDNTLYAASKAALQGFTRGLARDLGEKGITVNLVQPGPVDTDMNPANAPIADFIRSRMAIPTYGQPEDIAALVTFLTSEAAKFITGSIITIDGGFNT
jgi:3-oxoacyl-[acyl-carrier protein] reductase